MYIFVVSFCDCHAWTAMMPSDGMGAVQPIHFPRALQHSALTTQHPAPSVPTHLRSEVWSMATFGKLVSERV